MDSLDKRVGIRMPSSMRAMAWLHFRTHNAFSALVGLFDRVGLRTNVGKTVGLFCRPCQAVGTQ